jgi:hypothetical protein
MEYIIRMAVIRTPSFVMLVSLFLYFSLTLFHPQTCLALGEHTDFDFLKGQCVRIGAHSFCNMFLENILGRIWDRFISSVYGPCHRILKCLCLCQPHCMTLLLSVITTACFTNWTELPNMKRFWEISFDGAVVCLVCEQQVIMYDGEKHACNKGRFEFLTRYLSVEIK